MRRAALAVLLALAAGAGEARDVTQDLARDAERGAAIYARRCGVCHGDRGDGATWARGSLNPPPRDFTAADPAGLSRAAMIDAATHGRPGTAMVGFSTRLDAAEIAAVVDFIRASFMTGPAAPARGVDMTAPFPGGLVGDAVAGGRFYQANCAECHGAAGEGDGRRAYFMARKPRNFRSAEARARFNRPHLFMGVAQGVRGAPMPAWSKVLTAKQIADVAEYVLRAFILAEPAASPACGAAQASEGRRVYESRCYVCHGYGGDARTEAAAALNPKPRDFTAPPALSLEAVAETVRRGRAGSAMAPFAGLLSEAEIQAVAGFVVETFVACGAGGTRYHTAENGWPDHQRRYASAVPFAVRDLPVDRAAERMTQAQRDGLALFTSACVACHDGRRENPAPPLLTPAAEAHDEAYETGPHDVSPEIAELSSVERQGRDLYRSACAQCHAADGTGRNWIGRFLRPSPPDFTDPSVQARLPPAALAERMLSPPPGTSMPSFRGVLSREQAEAVAAYVARAFFGVGTRR